MGIGCPEETIEARAMKFYTGIKGTKLGPFAKF